MERAPSVVNLDPDNLPVERTLGMQWAMETYDFNFHIRNEGKAPTHRGILFVVSSVYDSLGFVALIILPAKSLLRAYADKTMPGTMRFLVKISSYSKDGSKNFHV